MAAPDPVHERHALLVSIVITLVLAVVGVAWGVLIGSQMILFDGIFAFVGIAVSVLLMAAARVSAAEPTAKYPYGRQAATPIVIGIQGSVILATLLYGAVEALGTIRDGGTSFAPGWAVLYSVLTTSVCVGTWQWLHRNRNTASSDLIGSEATAWRVAALRGVGMIVGFSTIVVMARSSWRGAAPFVDPSMVLVTCVVFLPDPLRLLRSTYLELMEGAPSEGIRQPVEEAVAALRNRHDLDEVELRITKVGSKLYVEVDVMADPDITVKVEEEIRTELESRLQHLPYTVWINLALHPLSGKPGTSEGPVVPSET